MSELDWLGQLHCFKYYTIQGSHACVQEKSVWAYDWIWNVPICFNFLCVSLSFFVSVDLALRQMFRYIQMWTVQGQRVSFWSALDGFLLGRQLYGLSALPPPNTEKRRPLSPGRCAVKADFSQTFWKIAFMSKPDRLDWRYTWKVVGELQGENILKGIF